MFQVRGIRGDQDGLFVSLKPPYKTVSVKTLARWMTQFLGTAGVDTSVWKQHSARAASAAYKSRDLSVKQICELADWSSAGRTFTSFYRRFAVKD